MKSIILDILKTILSNDGSLVSGNKSITTEASLLSINDKDLIKVYNQNLNLKGWRKYESIIRHHGSAVNDDFFRNQMIDKIYHLYNKDYVLYDMEIEDELYFGEDFENQSDVDILIIYNHNMFDHGYYKR